MEKCQMCWQGGSQVKVLATEPKDLSSIPSTHVVGRKNQPNTSCSLPSVRPGMDTLAYIH